MQMISVVIPTFNRGNIIAETIQSVLRQTHRNTEIIVVDDGSNDNTQDILRAYGNKLRCVYQNNQGVAAARNYGISMARGEYIAFLDSDDVYESAFLEEHLKCLQAKNADFVIAKYYYRLIERNSQVSKKIVCMHEDIPATSQGLYQRLFDHFIGDIKMLIKKSVLESVGCLNQKYFFHDDLDLWVRLAKHGYKGVLIQNSTPLYTYRVHQKSLMQSNDQGYEYLNERYHFFKSHALDAFSDSDRLRSVFANAYWKIGRAIFLKPKHRLKGLRILIRSQVTKPDPARAIKSFINAVKRAFKEK